MSSFVESKGGAISAFPSYTPTATAWVVPQAPAQPEPYRYFAPEIDEALLERDDYRIHTDYMYQLIHSPVDGASLDQLAQGFKTPILAFTGKCYREIRYIVERNAANEFAVFLAIKKIDPKKPHFLAFDWFMPGQTVSAGGVGIDFEKGNCREYFEAIGKIPYYQKRGVQRGLCHLHSHASFGVFWSSVDDAQQMESGDLGFLDDYRLYVVLNNAGDIKFSLVTYNPVLFRVDGAVCLAYGEEGYAEPLTRRRKKEIDSVMAGSIRKSFAAGAVKSEFQNVAVDSFYGSSYGADWGRRGRSARGISAEDYDYAWYDNRYGNKPGSIAPNPNKLDMSKNSDKPVNQSEKPPFKSILPADKNLEEDYATQPDPDEECPGGEEGDLTPVVGCKDENEVVTMLASGCDAYVVQEGPEHGYEAFLERACLLNSPQAKAIYNYFYDSVVMNFEDEVGLPGAGDPYSFDPIRLSETIGVYVANVINLYLERGTQNGAAPVSTSVALALEDENLTADGLVAEMSDDVTTIFAEDNQLG